MYVLVPDISSALQLLEHIQLTINESDDVKLIAQATDDLNFLISSLGNPILRSIVTIQVRTSFYLLPFYCLVHACLCRSERLIKAVSIFLDQQSLRLLASQNNCH